MCYYFISFVKEELLLCFPPMDYEEQKPINCLVLRNKLCHLFDKSTPQKSDDKERYVPTVLVGWVGDRDNRGSGMVPHLPSLNDLVALRNRHKRASENWAARDALEEYALTPKWVNRGKGGKRRNKTPIPDPSSQQDSQLQKRVRRLGQPVTE